MAQLTKSEDHEKLEQFDQERLDHAPHLSYKRPKQNHKPCRTPYIAILKAPLCPLHASPLPSLTANSSRSKNRKPVSIQRSTANQEVTKQPSLVPSGPKWCQVVLSPEPSVSSEGFHSGLRFKRTKAVRDQFGPASRRLHSACHNGSLLRSMSLSGATKYGSCQVDTQVLSILSMSVWSFSSRLCKRAVLLNEQSWGICMACPRNQVHYTSDALKHSFCQFSKH